MKRAMATACISTVFVGVLATTTPASAEPDGAASCQGLLAGVGAFHGPTPGPLTAIVAQLHLGDAETCAESI